MSARQPRLWAGRTDGEPVDVPAGLRLWLSVEGYPIAVRTADDEPVLLASTSDSPDAADVPAGTPSTTPSPRELLALVPAGYGLLVDGGTPARHVVPAQRLDRARSTAAPDGTERDLRTGPVPPEHQAVADAATRAGRAAGVQRTVAVWADGGGRAGLWVSLHRPSEAALDAVHDVVAAAGLAAPARVLDIDSLDRRAQRALFEGMARSGSRSADDGPTRLLTGRQELAVLAVAVLGSLLLVLGRQTGAVGTQVAGVAVLVALLAGVVVAARGRGATAPPVALGAGAVVAGLLVWQAVRGLG